MKRYNDWSRNRKFAPLIHTNFELYLKKGFYTHLKFSLFGITLFGLEWDTRGGRSVGVLGFWFFSDYNR